MSVSHPQLLQPRFIVTYLEIVGRASTGTVAAWAAFGRTGYDGWSVVGGGSGSDHGGEENWDEECELHVCLGKLSDCCGGVWMV